MNDATVFALNFKQSDHEKHDTQIDDKAFQIANIIYDRPPSSFMDLQFNKNVLSLNGRRGCKCYLKRQTATLGFRITNKFIEEEISADKGLFEVEATRSRIVPKDS